MKWIIIPAFWFCTGASAFCVLERIRKNSPVCARTPTRCNPLCAESSLTRRRRSPYPRSCWATLFFSPWYFPHWDWRLRASSPLTAISLRFGIFSSSERGWGCLTFWLLTCSGGAIRNASAFPSCRIRKFIRTRQSTSAPLCAAFRCLPPLRWCSITYLKFQFISISPVTTKNAPPRKRRSVCFFS